MSNKIFCFFFILLLAGQLQAQKKDEHTLTISEIKIPKVSIRAIEVLDNGELWFAGSHGKYGRISSKGIEMDSIYYGDKPVFFRSIAFNGKDIFILSIENPALLYKINPKNKTLGQKELVYKEVNEKVFYDSMTFFDEQNGIAMGDPTTHCLSVITTNDGGNTWQKVSCDKLPSVEEGEAAFAASNGNIATHNQTAWLVTGGKRARVFKSSDLGKSWEVTDTPIVQGGTMTGIFATDFYDKTNGIIMGGDWENKKLTVGTKAITKDGGKTWKTVHNNGVPGYISSVQYIPETKGKHLMAVSTEGIFYSKTKGKSWFKLSDKGYYTVRFINRNEAWLSGHEKVAKLTIK